jgi:hypothetical protein
MGRAAGSEKHYCAGDNDFPLAAGIRNQRHIDDNEDER